MSLVNGYVTNEAEVVARLKRLPDKLHKRLYNAIEGLGVKLQRHIKQDWLEGRALKKRTGTLQGSISFPAMIDTGSQIAAVVSTKLKYGIEWENGFDRKIGANADGGPRTLHGSALDAYFAKHPSGTKHYGARPFEKPALAAMERSGEIRTAIDKALSEAVK